MFKRLILLAIHITHKQAIQLLINTPQPIPQSLNNQIIPFILMMNILLLNLVQNIQRGGSGLVGELGLGEGF